MLKMMLSFKMNYEFVGARKLVATKSKEEETNSQMYNIQDKLIIDLTMRLYQCDYYAKVIKKDAPTDDFVVAN